MNRTPEEAALKLVVGLGNPEGKYKETRHNVGFAVLAALAKRHGTGGPKAKFHGELVEADLGGEKVLLLSPLTYMNRSGTSVRDSIGFYRLSTEDLLIICDDLNLPLAKLRFRARGSSGGQKGLADIIRSLGHEEFARLRIGIGSPPEGWDAADYVLSRFAQEEIPRIQDAVLRASDAVADWARLGIEDCMNRYN